MIEAECPSCRAKQDIMIWKYLDTAVDPDAKEQLFTGKINYFSCTSCDFEGFITAPLVYHDSDKKFIARYVPVEYFEDEEFLRLSFSADGRSHPGPHDGDACIPDLPYSNDAHIVFSMTELIRYVLFRDRLGQVFDETNDKE